MNFMVRLCPLKGPIVIITILGLIHIKYNITAYTQKIHVFLVFLPSSKNGSTSSACLDFLFPAGSTVFF
jgi:hypothetical protein